MEGGRGIMRQLTQQAALSLEAVPGVPVVEIAGTGRVLLENHLGIRSYSPERILIKTGYGHVCICGHAMEIRHLSLEQLVVRGTIDTVALCREGR